MKNFTVKASALAIAAALPGMASAVVNLNDGAGAKIYASELVPAAVTSALPFAGSPQVTVNLGFGVSNGQDRYIRFDLTGAKWATGLSAASLDAASNCGLSLNTGVGGVPTDALETLSTGGAVGGTSVIFQVTANVAGGLSATSPVCLDTTSVTLTSAAGASIKYQLYATAADAVTGGATGRLSDASATLLGSAPGLNFTVNAGLSTANVADNYLSFITGLSGVQKTSIGSVALTLNSVSKLSGGPAAFSDLISGANISVVGEDLSSAITTSNGVFLGTTTSSCVLTTASTKVNSTTRSIVLATPQVQTNVCYEASGNSAIAEQSFTVALDVTPASNSAAADVALQPLGSFQRDGTVLKAPFMTSAVGQYTFIQVANVSSVDAPWSVLCYGPSGPLGAGISSVLPGGTTGKLSYTALGCAAGTSAVELVINAPEGNVVGTLVRQSTSGGSTGLDSLTGNK